MSIAIRMMEEDPRVVEEPLNCSFSPPHRPPDTGEDSMWGPEEFYPPTTEDGVSWASMMTYTWASNGVYTAAREQLRVDDLPPPSRDCRARVCGLSLSAELRRRYLCRHSWAPLVGARVGASRDPKSAGALRWVGVPLQGGHSRVVAAVAWDRAPATGGGQWEEGEAPPFFNGVAYGERLFGPEPTENATLEDPAGLFFLDEASGRNTPPPPPPRRLSVTAALLTALPGYVWWQVPWKVTGDTCTLLLPVLLEKFVSYIKSEDPGWLGGLSLVMGLFVVQCLQSTALHRFYFLSIRGGLCYRSALSAVLFEKCFTISSKSLAMPEMSVGRIINMLSSDVERANEFLQFCMYLWSSPMVFVLAVAILSRLVGWCALIAVAAMTVTLPLNAIVMKRQMQARQNLLKVVDDRLKSTNEFISGIRIAKYMTWEPCFVADIEEKREVELKYRREVQQCRVLLSFLGNATPPLLIAIVFIVYHFLGHELTPEVVFPTISLLAILRLTFLMIPNVATMTLQFLISIRRISEFIECEDAPRNARFIQNHFSDVDKDSTGTSSFSNIAALFEAADVTAYVPVRLGRVPKVMQTLLVRIMRRIGCISACRPKEKRLPPNVALEEVNAQSAEVENKLTDVKYQLDSKRILHDISFKVPLGKFTLILGPTGSGKSSLLASLLGDFEVTRGIIWATKNIAYVPQQPWIMNATVRDNIVFFGALNTARLDDAIRVCQLETDLELMAAGLETEIGEKGINLSGGQKARVSLARAVYADREMYLLDEPLSALDARVGECIVNDVFTGVLRNKTRVLATHQLHILPKADFVVMMGEGTVRFAGSCLDFMQSSLYRELAATEAHENNHTEENDDINGKESNENSIKDFIDDSNIVSAKKKEKMKLDNKEVGKIITTEEKAGGSVPWSTYLAYFRACGGAHIAVLVLGVFLVTEIVMLSSNLWLSMWSSNRFSFEVTTYLKVYIVLVLLGTATVPLRFSVAYDAMRRGSRNLHRLMLRSVSTATMEFFDTTPIGRIINRFSRDVDQVDGEMPLSIIFLLQIFFGIVSSIAITIGSQPIVIFAILPCGFIYFRLMKFYNASNREVRRVGSTVKAPLISLLGEVLMGASTITAFGRDASIMQESLRRIDLVYASSFIENATNRWLGVRIEFLSNVIVTSIALSSVIGTMMHWGAHDIGLSSLSLTMALTCTAQFNWLVRQVGSVQADMNSVERILHYTNNIDHEEMPEFDQLVEEISRKRLQTHTNATATVVVEGDNSHDNNAAHPSVMPGWLEFRDVQMRYREGLPLVLNGVSFRTKPREKVGIVGRTGSGKSTLLLTFMRMVDISGGDIIVSGRPIRSYGLRELRRLFSMIPQDPVLFNGTVRSNLDPFLEATPAEVWHALDLVGMRGRIEADAEALESRVVEGGANFSVGQRQLLCLARALLKRGSGFILMDEATANIDAALDRQIQNTVMNAFVNHTVITIAHRLHTVALYDKIIVMDHGVVVEVGSPRELVSNPTSSFRGLVDALGKQEADRFMKNIESSLPPIN